MSENNWKKDEKKGRNAIEITIPLNGAISGANFGSNSDDDDDDNSGKKQKSHQSDDDDDDCKRGQMSNKSNSGEFSDEDGSKKERKSNKSDESNISVDATSKDGQMVINISEK